MEIRFYHLQRSAVDQALPSLLEKALALGMRAVVVSDQPERLESLDTLLWTYRPDTFLAHAKAPDPRAADQPIWLTAQVENPNGAKVLFLLDGAVNEDQGGGFDLSCELFDGGDEAAVAGARGRWKHLKEAGHTLTYWKQNERGGWEKSG